MALGRFNLFGGKFLIGSDGTFRDNAGLGDQGYVYCCCDQQPLDDAVKYWSGPATYHLSWTGTLESCPQQDRPLCAPPITLTRLSWPSTNWWSYSGGQDGCGVYAWLTTDFANCRWLVGIGVHRSPGTWSIADYFALRNSATPVGQYSFAQHIMACGTDTLANVVIYE